MNSSNSGFTRAELILVVALLTILAAVGCVSAVRTHMASNELSAINTLQTLLISQATWRSNDVDKNGVQDHWVADISGMATFTLIEHPDAPVEHVSLDIARADEGLNIGSEACVAGVEDTTLLTVTAGKAGYRYSVFPTQPDGISLYAVATDVAADVQHNATLFAYQAFPEAYNVSGVNMFIMSEAGLVWRSDASGQGVSCGGKVYCPLGVFPPNPPAALPYFCPAD